MSLTVRSYQEEDAEKWDTFCSKALQSTLLHTRRFLSYHDTRFNDQSLVIEENGRWIGVFPAALDRNDSTYVVSHPGITYGGVLHDGEIRGERMILVLEEIRRFYSTAGRKKLLYKAVPSIYFQAPAHDDLYALFRLNARRTRCDLSSAIDLNHRLPVSERRRRSFKKAIKAGVAVAEGCQNLPEVWKVLADNLARKHATSPVHSLDEISLLASRFPDNIKCIAAVLNNSVVAGAILFTTHTAAHAQYIASSDIGYEISALDAVFEHCIAATRSDGKRWFDFGISNENGGKILNEGLYRFKSEFGGGGVVHEFFELDI